MCHCLSTWALLLRDRDLYISSMLVATDSKHALKRSNLSFFICSNACLAFFALFLAASNSIMFKHTRKDVRNAAKHKTSGARQGYKSHSARLNFLKGYPKLSHSKSGLIEYILICVMKINESLWNDVRVSKGLGPAFPRTQVCFLHS